MSPKKPLPGDTIAIRQLLMAAAICLPLGFLATAAALLWLRHVVDSGPFWSWGIVGWFVHCLEFGLLGGLGMCAAVIAILSRRHYRLGYHRCPYCDRALKGIGKWCSCPEVQALKREAEVAAERPVA
jgi:hypothetical protein